MSDWEPIPKEEGWEPIPQVSKLESFIRGAGQGLTLGYEDEARAAILSKMSGRSYEEERDEIREKNRLAQEQNPWSYGGGSLVGAAGTMAVPGLNIAKGAGVIGGAAKAAALGGAAGYGASEEKTLEGQLKDVSTGALLSGGIQGVSSLIGKAAPAVGKKSLNVLTGVPEEVSERYLANPQAINAAKSLPEIAETIPQHLAKVREEIPELSQSAGKLLSSARSVDKGVSVGTVINELDSILKSSSDPDKLGIIKNQIDDLMQKSSQRAGSISENALADRITEQELKSIIKKLADQADFKNPIPSSDVAAINSASGKLNEILKKTNPEYASEVKKVAERINLRNSLIKKYGLEKIPGGGYKSTDRTVSALRDLGKINKMDRAAVADELKQITGADIQSDVMSSVTKDAFTKDLTRGSRNVNLGAMIGNAVTPRTGLGTAAGAITGGPMGAAIGAMAGATVDKYGTQIGKKALDATHYIQKLSQSPIGQKFIAPIQHAMSRGPQAVSATIFLLGQTDPEFRRLVDEPNQ